MGEGKLSFLINNIILLIVFLGLIQIVFNLSRLFFIGELILLGVFIVLALVSMFAALKNIKIGWILLALVYLIVILDIVFINLLTKASVSLSLLLIVLSAIGFLLSVLSIRKKEEEVEEVKPEVEKEFKPGKYVASKTGAKFHSPKCDWAKRIKANNRVWLGSKEEGSKKGYKACDCVK